MGEERGFGTTSGALVSLCGHFPKGILSFLVPYGALLVGNGLEDSFDRFYCGRTMGTIGRTILTSPTPSGSDRRFSTPTFVGMESVKNFLCEKCLIQVE